MTNSTELKQEIRRILQESSDPLGPSAIAKKLGLQRNSIFHHLKKLKEDGILISSEKGKYSINKDVMEIIKELEIKILNLLSSKEYYPRELQQELGYSESKILTAIHLLESDGLIKEGQISLEKRGGIPRKGLTSHVTDYCRDSTYIPTYLGYSKIGYCPICKEKMEDYETVVISFFRASSIIKPQPWKSVKIHSKCLPNSKTYEMIYGKNETSMFCNHCGLPLSPKTLPKRPITYKIVNDHFSVFELESIRLLEEIEQSWIVPLDIYIPDINFSTTPQNSTIEKVYNKLKIKIPEWLSERLKKDENNPNKIYYENISWEISKDLDFSIDEDLSELRNVENLFRILMKYRTDIPADYNVKSRINEIWTASLGIKKIYERKIYKNFNKLLGPEGNLYSCIGWAFDTKDYDFNKVRSDFPSEQDDLPLFSQTFSVKCGDNYFHPYCADKLRLNDNNNSKCGEKRKKKRQG